MRSPIFSLLAYLCLGAAAIVAILDGARSIGLSRLVWTSLDHFLTASRFIDLAAIKLYLLINLGADTFQFIDRFVLQAPLILVLGVLFILCQLFSVRRNKK